MAAPKGLKLGLQVRGLMPHLTRVSQPEPNVPLGWQLRQEPERPPSEECKGSAHPSRGGGVTSSLGISLRRSGATFAHPEGIYCSPDSHFAVICVWKCVPFCLSLQGNCSPVQCILSSPLSKYFLCHPWMLWASLWPPPRKGNVIFSLPPALISSGAKGERRGQRPRQVWHPPCMSFTLTLSSVQMVGCDYEIDSNATEDRCGVCLGDGSACQTVKKMFKQKEGSGNKQIHN